MDAENLRMKVAGARILLGIMLTPVFGLGLLFVVAGIAGLACNGSAKRRQLFYGNGSQLPQHPASVRI
jgi:hypothetical protein